MPKKLAFVCAYSPKLNTGMLTVDLGIDGFVRDLSIATGIEFEVNRFIVERAFYPDPSGRLCYDYFFDLKALIDEYDYLIYWGDFLHCNAYMRSIAKRMSESDVILDFDSAYDKVLDRLLLRGCAASDLERVFCIGGALHLNDTHDEHESRYINALKELYRNAGLIAPRDPLSTAYAMIYSGGSNVIPGLDCAFFFEPSRLNQIERHNVGLYSFQRALSKDQESLAQLERFVATIEGWSSVSKIRKFKWLGSNVNDPLASLQDKIALIASSAFIITDTYHCAINAMNVGVPVICVVGTSDTRTRSTLAEKKKEFLFQLLNARECLVPFEVLGNESHMREVKKKVKVILGQEQKVQSQIHVRLAELKTSIIHRLSNLIAKAESHRD